MRSGPLLTIVMKIHKGILVIIYFDMNLIFYVSLVGTLGFDVSSRLSWR
jgi:hypothetical protein